MIDISKGIDINKINDTMENLQELEENNEQFNEMYK